MKTLFFLIFILGIAGGGFFLFSTYEQKISSLHRDNILLKKQLLKITDQYKQLNNTQNNFTINFLNFDNQYGLISKGTIVYLSPYENSIALQKITTEMHVNILEKALINSDNWYYIILPIDSNVNSKGWVIESSFLSFSSCSTEIMPIQ